MTGDLNISVLTCDSEDKPSPIHKKTCELPEPPSGWFFPLIIVWALLGPLSPEPAVYTDIAGTSTMGAVTGGKSTTLASIREASKNVATVTIEEGKPQKGKSKITSIEYQLEKRNTLMEKALSAAEATSEEMRSINAGVSLDAAIKRKEKLIDLLKKRVANAAEFSDEYEENSKKLKLAEDQYEVLLS